MLIHKLKFNPHVVWSKNNSFHVFGYCNSFYHYLNVNTGELLTWNHGSFSYGLPTTNVHHFNKVLKEVDVVDGSEYVSLIRYGVYGTLSKRCKIKGQKINGLYLHFTHSQHSVIKQTFPVGYRTVENGGDSKSYIIQNTANFDKRDNDYVFAWGSSLVHERSGKCRIIKEPYLREQGHVSVTDAKFSPNGDKIAVGVKDGIRFLDPESLQLERELSIPGCKVHFLSYSEDGLTIAAITTCRKLIIWDVD